jgi:hypothetical protein
VRKSHPSDAQTRQGRVIRFHEGQNEIIISELSHLAAQSFCWPARRPPNTPRSLIGEAPTAFI